MCYCHQNNCCQKLPLGCEENGNPPFCDSDKWWFLAKTFILRILLVRSLSDLSSSDPGPIIIVIGLPLSLPLCVDSLKMEECDSGCWRYHLSCFKREYSWNFEAEALLRFLSKFWPTRENIEAQILSKFGSWCLKLEIKIFKCWCKSCWLGPTPMPWSVEPLLMSLMLVHLQGDIIYKKLWIAFWMDGFFYFFPKTI